MRPVGLPLRGRWDKVSKVSAPAAARIENCADPTFSVMA
jgi:hypothetical protein